MTFGLLKKLSLFAVGFCLLCVGGVSAVWTYYFPAEEKTQTVAPNITQWVYLPEGNLDTEMGESYTGVTEVVLNNKTYGVNNPNGMIIQAFNSEKLPEQGIVHSAQNNLSGGALKNALKAANAQELQFVIRAIDGTNPVEYYLYMFEAVTATKQSIGVYRVHLTTTITNGVSDGVYKTVDVKFGQGETYTPIGANFMSMNPLTWVETAPPTAS